MKKHYRLFIVGAVVCGLYSVGQLSTELYAVSKANKLADLMIKGQESEIASYYNPTSTPTPIHLGSMLYMNIHAHGKEGKFIGAGDYTPEHYYTEFRDLIAKNPNLAYEAWDLSGKAFIKRYNDGLIELNKNWVEELQNQEEHVDSTYRYTREYRYERDENGRSVRIKLNEPIPVYRIEKYVMDGEYSHERIGDNTVITYPIGPSLDSALNFDIDKYWTEQKALLKRHKTLIDELLKLDETTLNTYMTEIKERFDNYRWRAPFGSMHKWMLEKDLITPPSEEFYARDDKDDWSYFTYPCDLLYLATRVKNDYPKKWDYPAFFKEVKKFIEYVEKDLP